MKKIAYVAVVQDVRKDYRGVIVSWGDRFEYGEFDTYHEAEKCLRYHANYFTQREYDRRVLSVEGYLVPLGSDVCDVYDYIAEQDPIVYYDLKSDGDNDPWVYSPVRDLYEHSIFSFDSAWFDGQAEEGR